MPVSEWQRLLRRLLSGSCVVSLAITGWAPALLAAEQATVPLRSASAPDGDWLAQGRSGRGSGSGGGSRGGSGGGLGNRSAGRPGGGSGSGLSRPAPRPSGRPGGGAGAAAIGRPAPGFDRGNRRPAGGWVNNVPEGRPRPGGQPGAGTRPAPLPGGGLNRPVPPAGSQPPGGNRPGGNRPGGGGTDRPGLDRPDGNRPELNRPGSGTNRPGGGNRPDLNRPGGGDNRAGDAGTNRPDWNRPGGGNNRPNWNQNNRPNWNRPGWNRPDWVFNRRVNINTSIHVRPHWWGPTWSSARPWRYGWFYGPTTWGWWGGSSLAWGISSLASAAIISAAINNAVSSNTSTIDVHDSPYQLVFGTVTPVGADGVTFSFLFQGEAFEASADCRQGLINHRRPVNPEEAELINAACQVAFTSF